MNHLPKKDRMAIPRQAMPMQAAEDRCHNFAEVNLGLPILQAQQEATRCLECSHPKCMQGCPVGVKVRQFVDLVVAGRFAEAAAKVREDNVLPAITGRVCPQENQCEGNCILGKRFEPLGIGYLERFVADYEREHGQFAMPPIAPPTGRRVAIVGSGPAGPSAAGDLVQRGHEVVVFEALHEPGGVLLYGIPEFRLPKQIVRDEVENLRRMGIQFECNVVIGKTITLDELFQEERFDAVMIGTGAGLPRFLGVPGEHLPGVYSANEFLTRVNLMHANQFPEYDEPVFDCRQRNVAVIGGGNTAIDTIRTALRLGAKRAMVIYRRGELEMPARREEVEHARQEMVEFHLLTQPLEFIADAAGKLAAIRCIRMELSEPDADGRRIPVPKPGTEVELPVALAVVALGTGPNPLVQASSPHLKTNSKGYISADPETLQTSMPGVFAAGDIVTGSATVILAMGAGRKAAAAIDQYLHNLPDSGCHESVGQP